MSLLYVARGYGTIKGRGERRPSEEAASTKEAGWPASEVFGHVRIKMAAGC